VITGMVGEVRAGWCWMGFGGEDEQLMKQAEFR
jgi:hypothetical protein